MGSEMCIRDSNYLIWKLENFIEIQKPVNPDGIILLGGSFTGSIKALEQNQVGLGGNAERAVEALRLLRDNKNSILLFVADASVLSSDLLSEAEQAEKFFEMFNVNQRRLIIKKIANNTYQESITIAEHLRKSGGKWIMVTSARHMPRAIALMQSRDIGDSIIYPYATDFTASLPEFNFNFSFSNIGILDGFIHEIFGLFAYRITGRTNTLFPSLNFIPVNFN